MQYRWIAVPAIVFIFVSYPVILVFSQDDREGANGSSISSRNVANGTAPTMDATESQTIDWGWFAALGAIGAVIGGSLSNVVNHFVTMVQNKKKNQQTILHQRLQTYSQFIFYLEGLRLAGDALQDTNKEVNQKATWAPTDEELPEIFKAIDDLIKDKLSLLDYEILREWVYVKTVWYKPESTSHLKALSKLLISQHNDVVDKLGKSWGKDLFKIPFELDKYAKIKEDG
jgi:hypothetical protein